MNVIKTAGLMVFALVFAAVRHDPATRAMLRIIMFNGLLCHTHPSNQSFMIWDVACNCFLSLYVMRYTRWRLGTLVACSVGTLAFVYNCTLHRGTLFNDATHVVLTQCMAALCLYMYAVKGLSRHTHA